VGQLVVGVLVGVVGGGAFGGELGQAPLHLLPDAAERDPEDPLAALEEVHHLVGRGALVHAHAVAHQRDLRQVPDAPVAQVRHGRPDLLQGDPGVQQPLDDLEDEDVAEAVETLAARPVRGPHAGLDQRRPRPVVQLPVGDPGGGAGRGPAVAHVLGRRGHLGVEEQALLSGAPRRHLPVGGRLALAAAHRHADLRLLSARGASSRGFDE
jgi:hypothetical protein